MRKSAILALFVAHLVLPFHLSSTPTLQVTHSFENTQSSSISQELAEKILRKVSQDHGYDLGCICSGYAKGTVTIDKDPIGYTVTIREDGGSIATIQILDNL